jgi:hydroxymethylbilane synthase
VTERVRVGTRRSPLARAQTHWVVARLARAAPALRLDPVLIDTSGDRDRSIGSSPDFTDALDRALLRGEVDLAVHSAKDLPVRLDPGLRLGAVPLRADPRDCLVVAPPYRAKPLPRHARVGSSSLRRRAQLLRWRPDLEVIPVRGNVDTRIGLVGSGAVDAVVLATAGVTRLDRASEIDRILPRSAFLPAPAQGALAIVVQAGDSALDPALRRVDHRVSRDCVTAERAFAAALGGDCRVPLGALATARIRSIALVGEVLALEGRTSLRLRREGPASDAEGIGMRLGKAMADRGALELLSPSPR